MSCISQGCVYTCIVCTHYQVGRYMYIFAYVLFASNILLISFQTFGHLCAL